jgi:RHS repeat-associated protein
LYDIKDHLGNVRLVHDDSEQAKIYQGNYYSAFGVSILSLGDNMTPTQTVLSNDRLYNGKELQDGTNWLDYGARMYYPELGRWMAVDPSHEDGGQESSTPYGYVFNNPAGHTDPDGRIPHVVAGAIAGGLIGGAIEAGRQVWNEGKVSNWRAVGGAALQGAITGGAAAATGGVALANGGLSYLATAGAAAGANVVGGAASNAVQGKPINAGTMAKDAAIGAVAGVGGKFVGQAIEKYNVTKTIVGLAKQAKENVTSVTGRLEGQRGFGTLAHSELKRLVDAKGLKNVATETSYLNKASVSYGTNGSSRADVVLLNSNGTVKHIFDLKTGSAQLSERQISQYINNVPGVSSAKQITPIR